MSNCSKKESARKSQHKYIQKLIALGLCRRCGKGKASSGYVKCSKCLAEVRAIKKLKYHNSILQGLCPKCGKELDSKRKNCLSCRQKATQKAIDKRNRRRANGECTKCGQSIDYGVVCDSCRNYSKSRKDRIKDEIFGFYGDQCKCCGENTREFLQIDHINNDGNKHRRELGLCGGTAFYEWIIQNNFPDGFQVLCANCNFSKRLHGVCVHQLKLSQEVKNDSGIEYYI